MDEPNNHRSPTFLVDKIVCRNRRINVIDKIDNRHIRITRFSKYSPLRLVLGVSDENRNSTYIIDEIDFDFDVSAIINIIYKIDS